MTILVGLGSGLVGSVVGTQRTISHERAAEFRSRMLLAAEDRPSAPEQPRRPGQASPARRPATIPLTRPGTGPPTCRHPAPGTGRADSAATRHAQPRAAQTFGGLAPGSLAGGGQAPLPAAPRGG